MYDSICDYFVGSFLLCGAVRFYKNYERSVGQTAVTSLVMLVVTSVIGTVLYLFVGGFRVEFSSISAFWAILLAVVMIPYSAGCSFRFFTAFGFCGNRFRWRRLLARCF